MKEFWDNRYKAKEYSYGTAPNEFFKETLDAYQLSGKLLLPGEGEGRNAVYAAKKGLEVVAFDISEEAKTKAMQLANKKQVTFQYKIGSLLDMGFKPSTFDVIALIYTHFPPTISTEYYTQFISLLRHGGLLIIEGFSENNLKYREPGKKMNGPDKIEMLYTENKLAHDFSSLKILMNEETLINLDEGAFHKGKASVIRFIGEK